MRRALIRRMLLPLVTVLLCVHAWCGIPESEFRERRARLIASIDTSSAFAFRALDMRMRSNDVNYSYRQESNLLYLTGISEPGVTLILVPRGIEVDGKRWSSLLFCPEQLSNELGAGGVFTEGVILKADRLAEVFAKVASRVETLYQSAPDLRFVNDWLNNRPLFLEQMSKTKLGEEYAGLKVKNAAPFVAKLRERKSAAEIDLIRKAIRLTGDGIRHAAAVCRPGAAEYELQAALEYDMRRQGADFTAFPSIVGSGPNSLIPHYEKNTRSMNSGEVVVLDVGAECEGYSADITRTIPVSGTFTEEQARVYRAVLEAQEQVIKMIRPGVRWLALDKKAQEALTAAGFGHLMHHGVSHHLGLDTHDAGSLDTLKAGMVITVEPGVYIPANDTAFAFGYRGFGVRIEDDILVGEDGATVLSSEIPKELEEVEKLVGDPK